MRILIIEDDAKLAQALKASLEQHGYTVDVASNAADGDEAAVVERHNVIVLAARLRDMGGLELCRRLRRQRVNTPILMTSSLGETADKVAGLDAGADDYLAKPFHVDELLARLRSLMRRSPDVDGLVLHSGDLVLDLDEHRVRLGGNVIKLSAKEFALLEYMMRNPRRLLTRSMIAESVWDMNYESGSNVIDVYVSSLRRKLGHDPERPRIETVIGSGYRFCEPDGASDQGTARAVPPS